MTEGRGAALHRSALIIDGLGFGSDGYVADLRAGNVAAINVTVADVTGGFETCCDNLAIWTERLSAADSPWRLILTSGDVERARQDGKVGLIMGFQNMRPIADRLERLALFRELGVRVMQVTYNERNFLGSGCLDPHDSGLSALGRNAIRTMNRLGLAIDISHVGERSSLDIVEASEAPVLVTHANAKAVSDVPRNKSDDLLRAVAAGGGVIGTSVYGPMCWNGDPARRPELSDYLRHVDHIVDLVGIDHVALGTDFPIVSDLAKVAPTIARTLARYPGNVTRFAAAFGNDVRTWYLVDCGSPAALPRLTGALLARGWRDVDVRAFLGLNWLRVFRAIWGA